jgi:hypothetical protein
MWRALCFVSLSLCLCGCSAFTVKKNTFRAWAEARLRETTSFPASYTRKVQLGPQTYHEFKLNIHSADTVWLSCGNALILLLKDVDYHNQWAEIRLEDVDGDHIADLLFTARSRETPTPLKAIFLYRPDDWEHYLLPPHF